MSEEEFKKKAKTIPIDVEKEEAEAINYFKYKILPTSNGIGFESEEEHYTKVFLNLIEKLKKENEELHKEIERQGNAREIEEEYIEKKFVSKDKIRDFIKRLEKDVENIREKKKDSHDYDRSSSRIQAYLTKTNEIIKRLKKLLEEG